MTGLEWGLKAQRGNSVFLTERPLREQGPNWGIVSLNQVPGRKSPVFVFPVQQGVNHKRIPLQNVRVRSSKLVAGPQRPVVEIATGLRLLQEFAGIKSPIIRLEPQVVIRLPDKLKPRDENHPARSVFNSNLCRF